jgi:hypothetical protein
MITFHPFLVVMTYVEPLCNIVTSGGGIVVVVVDQIDSTNLCRCYKDPLRHQKLG